MKIVMSLTEKVIVLHHGEKIFEGKPQDATTNHLVIESISEGRPMPETPFQSPISASSMGTRER